MSAALPMEIRDPIHGVVRISEPEMTVIDHPDVQRLRGIRQLGFAHLPFPGATHTRYAHSIGAMNLAGAAYDAALREAPLDAQGGARRAAWRACTRLAALCHDLGHPPFSHAAEFAMPMLPALGLPGFTQQRQATHEDYTIALLTRGSLAEVIRANFPFSPEHVAALVSKEIQLDDDFFVEDGLDWRPLLSQLISSELDVDRLDYLVRDSYYTGTRYGQIDAPWLISHLGHHVEHGGRVCLALDHRAIYAFDDLMIARFHMFVNVYFHQKSIACEQLLKRYVQDPDCDWSLPADLLAYRDHDDAQLSVHLRGSDNPWARRLSEGRLYRVALEVHGRRGELHLSDRKAALQQAGIDVIEATSRGAVFHEMKPETPPIYVLDRGHGRLDRAVLLHEATELFHRYQDERCIGRLYVPGEDVLEARAMLVALA